MKMIKTVLTIFLISLFSCKSIDYKRKFKPGLKENNMDFDSIIFYQKQDLMIDYREENENI